MTRIAVYARYSSDQQREASIEDQFRVCRIYADREGWTIVREYKDAAVSGASRNRPGFQALVDGALRREFDIVVAESLDRLSRDQEHTANLFKRLSFAGVKIVTLADGDIGPLEIGFKGTMAALFLKDLADKTRRGLRGRVEAGKSGGGRCYGYRVNRAIGERGLLTTGDRRIEDAEAAVVVRIFEEFVSGVSPKAIAKQLNAEHVPGPRGGTWGPSTIHGHAGRGTGILNNELYIGKLVWNRQRYLKAPDTGKRVSRPNPHAERITTEVRELRIVPPNLWEAAKARQRATRRLLSTGVNFGRERRPTHLFSGLTKCGVCGSSFTMCSKNRLSCAGARDRGICENHLTILREEIEQRVIKAMAERLWNQELFDEFCKEFTRERNRLHGMATAAAGDANRETASIDRKIERWHQWIGNEWNGAEDAAAAGARRELAVLQQRRAELAATVTAAQSAQRSRPLLHPEMHKVYRDWVIDARDGLKDEDRRTGATTALRSMVEEILLTPEGDKLGIVLKGDLASILAAANPKVEAPEMQRQIALVAGAGFEPATFGL